MNKTLIILLINVLTVSISKSQYNSVLPQVIPPSPELASLGKYGDVPVNLYTGVPNISIPLYEIKAGEITVPIALSYNASGIKVGEEASSVGLGWILSMGGAVSRTIRGKEDFNWYLNGPKMIDLIYDLNGFEYTDYAGAHGIYRSCEAWVDGQKVDYSNVYSGWDLFDWEPDIFNFNFPGYSGKFFFDQQGNPHLASKQKLRITYSFLDGEYVISITTPEGINYTFSEIETHEGSNGRTGWYLTKIVSARKEEVLFSYKPASENRIIGQPYYSEQQIIANTGDCTGFLTDGRSYSSNVYSIPYLEQITFRGGKVLFNWDTVREDLKGAFKLKSFAVYDDDNRSIKTVDFITSYFISPLETRGGTNYSDDVDEELFTYAGKRLRLDKVVETNEGTSKPPYAFSYNIKMLPYKTSFNRDYWDFFNGDIGKANSTLIPSYEGPAILVNSHVVYYGANREPHDGDIKACILEKIKYPTGGVSTFEYEPTDYSNFGEEEWPIVIEPKEAIADLSQTIHEVELDIVGSIDADVSFNFRLIGTESCGSVCRQQTYASVTKFGESTPLLRVGPDPDSFGEINLENSEKMKLAPGKYILRASFHSENTSGFSQLLANYSKRVRPEPYKKRGGGIRILRVNDYSDENSIPEVRGFNYTTTVIENGEQKIYSTGKRMAPLKFYVSNRGKASSVAAECFTFAVVSYSSIPAATSAQGNPVGFDKVTELNGEGGIMGKTEYYYHNEVDRIGDYPERLTSIPTIHHPLNGYEKARKSYAYPERKVQEVLYNYELVTSKLVKAMLKEPVRKPCSDFQAPLHYYPVYSNLVQLKKTIETTFSSESEAQSVSFVTDYTYGETHLNVATKTITQSDGSVLKVAYKYATDFPTAQATDPDWASASIAKMTESHIIVPIEERRIRDNRLLSATLTKFKETNLSQILPAEVLIYRSKNAAEATEISIVNGGLSYEVYDPALDKGYERVITYDEYDQYGNVKQLRKENDLKYSYLWGYGSTLPIAKVENAAVTSIFHTSFEEDGTIDNSAKTGGKVKVDTYTFTPPDNFVPISGSILSYWVWDGLKWTYNEDIYSGGSFVISGMKIDEVRIYPAGARMTTYTYDPLIGIKSITDANNQSVFYEYDKLNRLEFIRDMNLNVVKTYSYRYKE
jgi:hypothetical protein